MEGKIKLKIKSNRKLNRKSGFTLVEIIVVLVILAIIAAFVIPALTGYFGRVDETKAMEECRYCVQAAQVTLTKKYDPDNSYTITRDGDGDRILKLAEQDGSFYREFGVEEKQVTHLYYLTADGKYKVIYCRKGGCSVCKKSKKYTVVATDDNVEEKSVTNVIADALSNLSGAGSNSAFDSAALSKPDSQVSAIWKRLDESTKDYLENKVWKLENKNYTYNGPEGVSPATVWRIWVAEKENPKPGEKIIVYKYFKDTDGNIWRQTYNNAIVKEDGTLSVSGNPVNSNNENHGWVKVSD